MINEYMLIPYHLRERLSDALFMSDMCCDDLRNIVASAPMHSIPAHDGEVVYLIYHGDGECAVDEVSKADYDEHDGPKRILYTAPSRVMDLQELAAEWEAKAGKIGDYTQERTAASSAIRDCADQLQAALEKP